MARICPALQQLLNTKEISTLENLSSTPRRKPIKWSVLVPSTVVSGVTISRDITATIERMNRRVGAGLPLSTMAKRDGKHKSGMPVAAVAKTPKAPKPTKAPKAKPVKAPKPAKVKATKTKRGVKVVSTTATATIVCLSV